MFYSIVNMDDLTFYRPIRSHVKEDHSYGYALLVADWIVSGIRSCHAYTLVLTRVYVDSHKKLKLKKLLNDNERSFQKSTFGIKIIVYL